MNTEKLVRESKMFMFTGLIIGLLLLVTGIVFKIADVNLITNKKAIIGLSFIPFGWAFVSYLKLSKLRKSPDKVKKMIINETDERLGGLKNEVDAKAFKFLQGSIFLTYMGYTLAVPADVFESIGWWILLALLFASFISQGVLSKLIMSKANTEGRED